MNDELRRVPSVPRDRDDDAHVGRGSGPEGRADHGVKTGQRLYGRGRAVDLSSPGRR